MLKHFGFVAVLALSSIVPVHMTAQKVQAPGLVPGNIIGTATDLNGYPVPNARVVLEGPEASDVRSVVTGDNGFFQFDQINPGTSYQITIRAKDFADWRSPTIMLDPGQFKILSDVKLRIQTEHTTVEVKYDPVEVATEQLKLEENQRAILHCPATSLFRACKFEAVIKERNAALRLRCALPSRVCRAFFPNNEVTTRRGTAPLR